MTVEFYKELDALVKTRFLPPFGATETYNNLIKHIEKYTSYSEGYLQTVRPGDPDYDVLPSNIRGSSNRRAITEEGLDFVREEFFNGKPIRGVGPLTIPPLTIAFNALQDKNE